MDLRRKERMSQPPQLAYQYPTIPHSKRPGALSKNDTAVPIPEALELNRGEAAKPLGRLPFSRPTCPLGS